MNFDLVAQRPWESPSFQSPPVIDKVMAMLTYWEKRMLYWLALHAYEAEGFILDQGAFLGGSTICFAAGLRNRGFASPLIHSYDLFRLGPFEVARFFADGGPPGNVTRPLFDANVAGFRDLLVVHEGDLLHRRWSGDPIEILFVDVAKTAVLWDHVIAEFFPSLIPGTSLVILQDYLYGDTGPWHHVGMERLAPFFEMVADAGVNSVLFRYMGGLTREAVASAQWQSIPRDERVRLMDAAIARFDTEEKRAILSQPRQALLSDLARGDG
jgi:hypothetical protein